MFQTGPSAAVKHLEATVEADEHHRRHQNLRGCPCMQRREYFNSYIIVFNYYLGYHLQQPRITYTLYTSQKTNIIIKYLNLTFRNIKIA